MATLREKAKGIVITGYGKYGIHSYNIGFNNGDETQIDAHNINELCEVWNELHKEFGVDSNSVDYVERIN